MTDPTTWRAKWQKPEILLILMAGAMAVSLNGWMALINNFAYEEVGVSGWEIGVIQGIREVPGFLAFGVIFAIMIIREQRLAMMMLFMLGVGTALTGFFPQLLPLYVLTFVGSLGFHYFETLNQSLTLQWIDKKQTPVVLGRQISAMAIATIAIYLVIILANKPEVINTGLQLLKIEDTWTMEKIAYEWVFLAAGGFTAFAALVLAFIFPGFVSPHPQEKKIILRRRYWLYYALVFMSGARRQIFMVFAAFMMVEKFGYGVAELTLLFLINHLVNIKIAPLVGRLIVRFGERNALLFEYAGLAVIFSSYAFVQDGTWAAALYIADHLFFAFAIAIKTYFQKIADPKDMASTAGVSFTINHIAAVFIPPLFGLLWLTSPAAVFLAGAAMAVISFILSLLVPHDPQAGQETIALDPMGWLSRKARLSPNPA